MSFARTNEYNLKAPISWKLRHKSSLDFMNVANELKEELNRRIRGARVAFASVREATDQLTDQDLSGHLFGSTILTALCYAAETWADTAATSKKLLTTHRAFERCVLKFNRRTQHLAALRSSDL